MAVFQLRARVLPGTLIVLALIVLGISLYSARAQTPTVFINEIHYDDGQRNDVGEAVEVAGPAGTNLTGWSLVLYDGARGTIYDTAALTAVISDQGSGFGTVVVNYSSGSVQNGGPDGLALVDGGGAVVQFLSYEGIFTATNGPAIGLTSEDIGVSESGGSPAGNSLQLTGTGTTYSDFTWAGEGADTFGSFNTGQSFSGEPGSALLIINEVDYNQPGTDSAEFIEITNIGTAGAELSEYTLELVDGSGGGASIYTTINLPSGPLPSGDYFVICGDSASVLNCDLDVSPDSNLVQNGAPDAIGLRHNGSLTDAVSYDGDTGAPYTEGTGAGLLDDDSLEAAGISRYPDGVDTGQNSSDFSVRCISPGLPNLAISNDCIPPDPPDVEQLLLTEIIVSPTGGEYIEIFNPGSMPFDLSDVYLTDATFAGGGSYYYNVVTGGNSGGGTNNDFLARFPDGSTIGPGEYQTIALNGSTSYANMYGQTPDYELYEDRTRPDNVLDMREGLPGSVNEQGGLSNDGEVVVLFYWDGVSDLVTDLDYTVWGDKEEAVDKTGVAVDGPDVGVDPSGYLADTPVPSQDVLATSSHNDGESWQREDLTEGAEVQTGGNGAGGHNETSEDLSNSWCSGAPTPGSASNCDTGGGSEFCFDPATFIHEVQGSGLSSPLVGNQVVIEGVVTAVFQGSGQIGGYYLQEEDIQIDSDPASSEGVYIFDNSNSPTVGNVIRVQGTIAEFNELTEMTNVNDYSDCGPAGFPTPASINLPVGSLTDFESVEGMLVTFPQALVISEYFNFDRFNEIVLSSERHASPTSIFEPGPDAIQAAQDNALDRITIDDARTGQNPDPAIHPNGGIFDLTNLFRGGDTVQNVTGVMDYAFGIYRVQPIVGAEYTALNPRPASPADVGGSLKIGTLNVLNYFTTIDRGSNKCGPNGNQECRGADSRDEFTRQRDKIISALIDIDADVVGLVEIENHPADVPVADLVSGLNDLLGAGSYDYVATGSIGTDAIRVALIYRPAEVSPVGTFAVLDSSVDSRFIDSKNRPVLAQSFVELSTGEQLTIAVSHLKSKGSACDDVGDPDTGNGAGNCNLTRTSAAEALVDWLDSDPTGSGDSDFLLLGDLNSYAKEDPIDAVRAGPDDLAGTGDDYTDLILAYQGETAYSYVFDAATGYLDYALASSSLAGKVTGTTIWHINADEPDLLDYDTSFKAPAQAAIYEPNAYRASDHDPVLVGLDLTQ